MSGAHSWAEKKQQLTLKGTALSTPIDSFALYQESKTRLNAGKGDARDELVVALWSKSRTIMEERNNLKRENNFLSKQRSELAYANQLLESRLHILTEGPISIDFEDISNVTHH